MNNRNLSSVNAPDNGKIRALFSAAEDSLANPPSAAAMDALYADLQNVYPLIYKLNESERKRCATLYAEFSRAIKQKSDQLSFDTYREEEQFSCVEEWFSCYSRGKFVELLIVLKGLVAQEADIIFILATTNRRIRLEYHSTSDTWLLINGLTPLPSVIALKPFNTDMIIAALEIETIETEIGLGITIATAGESQQQAVANYVQQLKQTDVFQEGRIVLRGDKNDERPLELALAYHQSYTANKLLDEGLTPGYRLYQKYYSQLKQLITAATPIALSPYFPGTCTRVQTDIFVYPPHINNHDVDEEIIIGDLHANTIKLIHFLIEQGVLIVSEQQFAGLVQAYKDLLDATADKSAALLRFETILSVCRIKNPCCAVRLMGDEVGDRGAHDKLNFKLFNLLKDANVRLHIMASNHGVNAYIAYEKRQKFTDVIGGGASRSLQALGDYVGEDNSKRREVDQLIQPVLTTMMQCIDYRLSPDGKFITVFTHAPIDLDIVREMAISLGITYDDSSIIALAMTIEFIKHVTSQLITKKKFHTLFPPLTDLLNENFFTKQGMGRDYPFWYAIWNRNETELERGTEAKALTSQWNQAEDCDDDEALSCRLQFVYGHHPDCDEDNVYAITIDNDLGKFHKGHHNHQGQHTVIAHKAATVAEVLQQQMQVVRSLQSAQKRLTMELLLPHSAGISRTTSELERITATLSAPPLAACRSRSDPEELRTALLRQSVEKPSLARKKISSSASAIPILLRSPSETKKRQKKCDDDRRNSLNNLTRTLNLGESSKAAVLSRASSLVIPEIKIESQQALNQLNFAEYERSHHLLAWALMQGDVTCVKEVAANLEYSALQLAVITGDTVSVRKKLNRDESEYNIFNNDDGIGYTLFHLAARFGQEKMLETLASLPLFKLVTERVLKQKSKTQCTPLDLAVRYSSTRSVEQLMAWGAEINDSAEENESNLHVAIRNGNFPLVKLLCNKDKLLFINAINAAGETPLHVAVHSRQLDIFEYLLSLGAALNITDDQGETPLTLTDDYGNTVLHLAISQYAYLQHNLDFIWMLIEKGADMYAENHLGLAPIMMTDTNKCDVKNNLLAWIIASKDVRLLKTVLQKNADTYRHKISGDTLFHFASSYGCSPEMASALIENIDFKKEDVISIDEKNKEGRTALHLVASRSTEVANVWLRQHPASLNEKDKQYRTALHDAITSQNTSFLHTMLFGGIDGVDANIQNHQGNTPLHQAIKTNFLEGIRLLVQASVDFTLQNDEGKTALTITDANGNNALHQAAMVGDRILMENLLRIGGADAGILLNARNHRNETAGEILQKKIALNMIATQLQTMQLKQSSYCHAMFYLSLDDKIKKLKNLEKEIQKGNKGMDDIMSTWAATNQLTLDTHRYRYLPTCIFRLFGKNTAARHFQNDLTQTLQEIKQTYNRD